MSEAFKIGPPLPASFYLRDTITVARELLGKGLYVFKNDVPFLVEIVEVEAYLGSQDAASHAYRGITKRNWPMFELGGTCYVYLSYGINFCMNVATGPQGTGEAILFRAALPVIGKEGMQKLRGKAGQSFTLMNGPGKLTQALGIDLSYNGRLLNGEDFRLVDLGRAPSEISDSPRIGISKATEERLRFFVAGSPWVSKNLKPKVVLKG